MHSWAGKHRTSDQCSLPRTSPHLAPQCNGQHLGRRREGLGGGATDGAADERRHALLFVRLPRGLLAAPAAVPRRLAATAAGSRAALPAIRTESLHGGAKQLHRLRLALDLDVCCWIRIDSSVVIVVSREGTSASPRKDEGSGGPRFAFAPRAAQPNVVRGLRPCVLGLPSSVLT